MLNYFQRKYAMSEKGAADLTRSILWTSAMEISFMLPVILAFLFLQQTLQPMLTGSPIAESSVPQYLLLSAAAFLIMFFIAYFQYNATYTKIYEESARRRISLAETLRKLPLAFFGKKDIADLSATIMEDATQIEQLFSHAVPQIYASVITVFLMGVMMFFYNWQLSLAVFWVVPVAAFVFYRSRQFQAQEHSKLYHVKRDISDTIQEGLESIHEIKAYNREADYAARLNQKLDGYEKQLVKGELLIGASINVSYAILKLGLPSTIVVGAYLLATGAAGVFPFIAFLIIASRIYNPLMEVMNNLAMLLYLSVRINRMKEMDAMPRQEGATTFRPKNYDIAFHHVDFSYLEGVQTLRNVMPYGPAGTGNRACGPLRRGQEHGGKAVRPVLGC